MMSKEKRRVPKLRFPGFTEDWEQRKLGDVAIITGGGTPSTNVPEYWNGDIDWYSPVEIGKNRYVSKSTRKITKLGLEKSSAKLLPIGTVLFTSRAGIGNTAILQAEGCTNQGFQSITPDSKELDTYFLYTMTPRLKRYGEVTGAGSTFVEVSGKQMEKMSLVLPSLEEQKQIGRFFRTIDDSITLHQRKLNNLKLKKKALLQKLFPKNEERYPELRFPGFTDAWEQRKFKDIAFKRGKISEADLPYVEFEDINSGIGTLNKNISQKVGHKKGLLFEAGDVLFGKLRPYLQNWLLCQFAGIAVGDFWVLQPQNVSSAFLYYLIQSEAYQSVANISSGTKMPRSSWPLVSETLFSIPKYKEANMIGEFFLLIDRTITLHQRKLDHLQLQKKALLQQMFV
ncbi:MAG: restriction endonuclease subunit S [Veillonella sp.]|nr:restriction endonuclease subunit S [Veillonella sp.]